ncbi:MAG TPA: hypothetical protein VGC87_01495 [Pyrinomonadaceae bacterium]
MTIKRLSSALFVTLFALALSARAQTPSVSTINITPDEKKVRIAAVGDVLDMWVSVSDESGDVVFESGPVTGDHLDWTMSDPQGQRVPVGTYALTITYRTPSGKLKRRVEQVSVIEALTTGAGSKQESPTPQAVATMTGQGTAGRISKFTGANAIGDSVMFENAGRIGFGTTAPQQGLHAVGASSRLRLQSTGGTSLTTTEYVTNGRVWQSGAGGSTAANGVANKFFVFDQTANQFRLVLDTAGNFGVGTTAPTAKLTVNGGIQILGSGNGIKFPDGSIQTKAIAGTINGTGTANRLAKFTGPNSFGNSSIAEVSGNVGIGTTAPTAKLDVIGSISASSVTASSVSASSLTTNSFQASDNVGQSAYSYGIVKAMLRMQGDGTQVYCYNGATKVSSSSFASCGFSVTANNGGVYNIDFGSAVNNTQYRFVSLSGSSSIILTAFPATTSIQVAVGNTTFGYAYYIIVY